MSNPAVSTGLPVLLEADGLPHSDRAYVPKDYAAWRIDETGQAFTVTAAGTPVACEADDADIIDAGSVGSMTQGSSSTKGRTTIGNPGDLLIRAWGEAKGENCATLQVGIMQNGSAIQETQLFHQRAEGASAAFGAFAFEAVVSDAEVDDYFSLCVDSGTNCDTVTLRNAGFSVEIIKSNKTV